MLTRALLIPSTQPALLARSFTTAARSVPSASRTLTSAAPQGLMVEDRDLVRWITLNRPSKLNALTLEDLDKFTQAVQEAPNSVRAIAVTGAGRSFCAGMNTAEFEGLDRRGAAKVIDKVAKAVGALRLSPKPTAVVIHGHCLGAGFEMALAADFRVTTPNALVGMPEVKVGVPSVVDAALLQRHVGLSLAKEMLLTGDIYPIKRLGDRFVQRHADYSELEDTTDELLQKVTGLTPTVMAAQKGLHETWMNLPLEQAIKNSIDVFASVFAQPETHQAILIHNKKCPGMTDEKK